MTILPDPGATAGPAEGEIGTILALVEALFPGCLVLLAAGQPGSRILVANAGGRGDLVGTELQVPDGLLADGAVTLPTAGKRVPLAWTLACGDRPASFVAVPVDGHALYLVAAGPGDPLPEARLAGAARIVSALLETGRNTHAQADIVRRMNALVRHLPIPLAFVDAQGLQVLINDEAAALLGLEDAAAPIPVVAAALTRLISSGKASEDGPNAVQRALTRDPRASLRFEVERGDAAYKVESRWIDDDGLSGRIWLFSDVTEARALQLSLAKQANEDPLTGVLNRRSFERALALTVQRARADGFPLSLLMLDLDHFKRINDTYGHPAGDAVLRDASRVVAGELRHGDMLARIGGEEFGVLLPETGAAAAAEVAARLCAALRTTAIVHDGRLLNVTCSIGVASFETGTDSGEAMMGRGDAALYEAKRAGRDRVVVAGDTPGA